MNITLDHLIVSRNRFPQNLPLVTLVTGVCLKDPVKEIDV
jgi:hypothetical protein